MKKLSATNCDDAGDELDRTGRIPGYKKNKEFLVKARLYGKYKDRISTAALPNAKHLEKDRPIGNKRYPRAGVYVFFDWYLAADRLEKLKKGEV